MLGVQLNALTARKSWSKESLHIPVAKGASPLNAYLIMRNVTATNGRGTWKSFIKAMVAYSKEHS